MGNVLKDFILCFPKITGNDQAITWSVSPQYLLSKPHLMCHSGNIMPFSHLNLESALQHWTPIGEGVRKQE